jgi:HlyD family secretion protein
MSTSSRQRTIAMRLLSLTGLALALALGWWLLEPAPIDVEVTTPRRGLLQVTLDEQGETRVRARYVVSAPLAGRVLRIEARPGDPVVANRTALVTFTPAAPALLDTRSRAESRASVAAAEAALSAALADLERTTAVLGQAERELTRVRSLVAAGALPRQRLEQTDAEAAARRGTAKAADAAVATARAGVERAQAALIPVRGGERPALVLKSPIDGVVLRRERESEAVVAQGEPLLEVGDTRQLEIVADFVSSDAVAIRPGQPVLIGRWGGGAVLNGRVRRVEPSGFTKVSALGVDEQRVNVVIDTGESCEEWTHMGDRFRVEVRVVVWESADVLSVPVASLVRDGDRWSVFIVRDGRAWRVPVDVGRQNDVDAQILAGLAGDETVIVYPGESIDDDVGVVATRRAQ